MPAKRRKKLRKPAPGGGARPAKQRSQASGGWISRLRPHGPSVIVFAVALGIRLLYLVQVSDSPSFLMPLVDSEIYDRAARGLAAGHGFGDAFIFQPFFYPFFLGLVYSISGSSIVAVKVVQAVVGALTCAVACGLGTRLHDDRTGLVAGVLIAVYGPPRVLRRRAPRDGVGRPVVDRPRLALHRNRGGEGGAAIRGGGMLLRSGVSCPDDGWVRAGDLTRGVAVSRRHGPIRVPSRQWRFESPHRQQPCAV
jgi:hypothetical protein